jgi:hypothetical protein
LVGPRAKLRDGMRREQLALSTERLEGMPRDVESKDLLLLREALDIGHRLKVRECHREMVSRRVVL